MSNSRATIRITIFAAGAVVLFCLFAVSAGVGTAWWYRSELSRSTPMVQAPRFRLPAGWAESSRRGVVSSLAAAHGHIFAAGPGLGVYRSVDGRGWLPMDNGLPPEADTTHIFAGELGLFVLDRDLRVFRWDANHWSSIGVIPEASRVIRLGQSGNELVAATDFGLRIWAGPKRGWSAPGSNEEIQALGLRPPRTTTFRSDRRFEIDSNARGGWIIRSGEMALPLDISLEPAQIAWIDGFSSTVRILDGPWQSAITDVELWPVDQPAVIVAAGDARVFRVDVAEEGFGLSKPMTDGLPPASCTALAVNREDLFVGTAGHGVYRFDSARNRFEPVNLGLLHLP